MIVADSDILIDALRGREPASERVVSGLGAAGLATTAVSVFELLSGAYTEAQREKVERLLRGLTVLPLDEEAGARAADLRRTLETRGAGLHLADYLIAGICLSHSAALLTRNRAHFERVPSLILAPLC